MADSIQYISADEALQLIQSNQRKRPLVYDKEMGTVLVINKM